MKKNILALFVLINFIFIPVSFSADLHYAIIVDAGSTGSRLHLFQFNADKKMPVITDIFSEKNALPLSSFAGNPSEAGESLKPLLDDAVKKLNETGITENVPIQLLGTAGMRLLSEEEQNNIYMSVKKYLTTYYSFDVHEVETITGKSEGLYDWLDVNYIAKRFQEHLSTLGAIDMGGASTQIAFSTTDASQPFDETKLTINDTPYVIFSKSFLSLGLDEARNSINTDPNASSCYPLHYPLTPTMSGYFIFPTCQFLYNQLILNNQVSSQLLPIPPNQSFFAFSGVYYTYHFFGVDPTPDQSIVQDRIQSICSESWEELKKEYPNESDSYLSNYCANGTYLTDLLYETYHLQGSQLQILNKINQQSIDWTLGAMLYQLIK